MEYKIPKELDHLTEWFWNTLHKAEGSALQLKEILESLSDEKLYFFQEQFVDASVELKDLPYTKYMVESEDGVEDIAHWVVSQGKVYYLNVWYNPSKIPYSVESKTHEILYGVGADVYFERFGVEIDVYG